MVHTEFQTTSQRRLNRNHPAMRLWEKAKSLGVWNPRDIDFSHDIEDWGRMSDLERELILHLTANFQAGEEAVVLDLLPLIRVISTEGRLEEEIFLTSFLWEEAKHVDAFSRFFDEIARDAGDLSRFHGPCYRQLFYEELPTAMERLEKDSSPEAMADASVTYNLIVEGVLAETGYHGYYRMLRSNQLMPGMQQVIDNLKRDESRHLAYGVFLLSRLMAEHGEKVWKVIENRMNQLLPIAMGMIDELFSGYPELPFDLDAAEFVEFATTQFQHRIDRIAKSRGQSLDELFRAEDFELPVAETA